MAGCIGRALHRFLAGGTIGKDAARARFTALDASLEGSVEATRAKIHKLLDKLEGQGRRALVPSACGGTGRANRFLMALSEGIRRRGWPMCMCWRTPGRRKNLEDTLNRSFLEG